MSEVKIKALEKMNQEMNTKHSDYEDYIHNMLCDLDEDEIFENILKDGKTIKDCYQYLENYAFEHCDRTGNVGKFAQIPSKIMEIIMEYYSGDETEVKSKLEGKAMVSTGEKKLNRKDPNEEKTTSSDKRTKKSVQNDDNQLSIFDLGFEEDESCDCDNEDSDEEQD